MRTPLTIGVACAVLLLSPFARADYYIVVNDANPQTSLTRREALHLFMGRTRSFPDGSIAQTYDIQQKADSRAGFYRALSGLSIAQVTSYWARLTFSGQSLPPRTVTDSAAMLENVRKNRNAIGWLDAVPVEKNVRVVLILKQ
jgi:hypothetical protein